MIGLSVSISASLDGKDVFVLGGANMGGFNKFWAFVFIKFFLFLAHALKDFNGISAAVLQSLLLDINSSFFSGLPSILIIFRSIVVLGLKLD